MYGDYGYMEEGKLGKPYNLRLLRRLAPYATPYKKTIGTALLLTLFITLFDLAFPFLAKVAIDRYILSSWYVVSGIKPADPALRKLTRTYGHLLEKGADRSLWAISDQDLRSMAPDDLHLFKTRGILSQERFYRITPDLLPPSLADWRKRTHGIRELADGALLIPFGLLSTLQKEEILQMRGSDIRGVTLVGAALLLSLLFIFGLNYGEHYLLELTGQRIMQDIRLRLFGRIQSQSLRFFDRQPVGRLVTRVTNDIENLNEMFKSVIVTVFKDFFLLAGIVSVLLYLNPHLALVCFALMPIIFGLTFLFSTLAREAFRELRVAVAKINAFLEERISGMRVIQLFTREDHQLESFRRINHENYLAGMKQIQVFAVFMPIMEFLAAFAVALIIWHGGGRVIQEQLTLGSLVAFISYMRMFFKPVRDISEKYNIMQSAMASTERIFEFMDYREEIPRPAAPMVPPEITGHLVLKDVSFGYRAGRPVLREISFEVKPGETVALVGATGAGKTTLVNLVERFYDPDQGALFLDGVDLRQWPLETLRKNIGLCMQDVFIFGGNAADNISLGREGIDPRAVEAAARHANADAFIRRLSKGYDQEIAEGGATLSAGQRQLLSFARALAANPALLILDEATSSVDPETERLIQEAIARIAAKRTTLVVAHRLSTIRNADRILVMHRGRLVEQGSHEELLALQGIYFKLNRLREA